MATKKSDEEGTTQRAVQSVEVGGRLLLVLSEHREPMALKDLANAAGLSPARAHHYLVSFGKLRLIEQEALTGRYALGPAALQMGLTALNRLEPIRVAEPIAEQLARETGYAVALAVWGSFGPTVIRMIEARHPLLVAMRVGTVMSVLGTATGRAFAAAMPDERVAHALGGALGDEPMPMRKLSKAALTVLKQARADIAAHGVVRAEGRPIPSVSAFSAPAWDHTGTPCVVITALGHQDEFPTDWNASGAALVRAAAAEISMQLGWRAAPSA